MDGAGHGPAVHVRRWPSLVIVVWAVTGPLFGFSDTWQLVINTGTTIVTFLMVFLIQNTQNRDSEAMQVKLDEIIRAIGNAKNELLDLEELEEEDLDEIRETYVAMAKKARDAREKKDARRDGGCRCDRRVAGSHAIPAGTPDPTR